MAEEQAKRERPPWIQLAAIGLVALYALLFIVLNTHRAKVSFVFGDGADLGDLGDPAVARGRASCSVCCGSRLNRRRKRRG